jgi:CheY-like chemotaxis protein
MATLSEECFAPGVVVQPACGNTILVVEDDRFVRVAACELLRESGFDVYEAENAAAVRACFFSRRTQIDALLCDAVLPDGNGFELCSQLQADIPTLRVVVTSGYPMPTFPYSFNETGGHCFLKKPYSGESLMALLRRIITNELPREPLRPLAVADSLQNVPG